MHGIIREVGLVYPHVLHYESNSAARSVPIPHASVHVGNSAVRKARGVLLKAVTSGDAERPDFNSGVDDIDGCRVHVPRASAQQIAQSVSLSVRSVSRSVLDFAASLHTRCAYEPTTSEM